MHTPIIAAFGLYFAVLLVIGLLSHRKQHTAQDFIVGNRSLNFWLTALSAHASDMSAWLFFAFPSALYLGGLPQIWTAFGLVLGMFLNWQIVAYRLRTDTEARNSYTMASFFERRFSDTSGVLSLLTAFITLLFLTSYLSAGLIAMGLLLETIFQIDYYFGLSVAVCVVVAYTYLGGFLTVAWTDLFQGLFLLVAIVAVPFIAFQTLPGGWQSIESAAADRGLMLWKLVDHEETIFSGLFLMAGWGLGYFGQPHIITKFMGIRSAKDMYKAKYLGISWQVIVLSAAACIGIIGIPFFQQGLADPQLVFVSMVQQLFSPFWSGLVLCAVLAATISTMDSQLLVCASVLSEDVYKRCFFPKASSKAVLQCSRLSVIAVAAVALVLAFDRNATILNVVFYAWSGLGCAFGPLVLAALYARRVNRYGAIAGMLVGSGIATFWPALDMQFFDTGIPAMIPGFLLSLGAIFAVSRLTKTEE